jgi:hypothetical protein
MFTFILYWVVRLYLLDYLLYFYLLLFIHVFELFLIGFLITSILELVGDGLEEEDIGVGGSYRE